MSGTVVDHRWEGRESDRETYDEIFSAALSLVRLPDPEEKAIGRLLFEIVNAWEKDGRSVPLRVLSAALDCASELAVELIMEELEEAGG